MRLVTDKMYNTKITLLKNAGKHNNEIISYAHKLVTLLCGDVTKMKDY